MMKLMVWLVTALSSCKTRLSAERLSQSKACKAVIMTLAIILTLMPGSTAQKKALLEKIFAKAKEQVNVKQDRLWAVYLKWRQRKCWMWGGGFMAQARENTRAAITSAQDLTSFDALIPN